MDRDERIALWYWLCGCLGIDHEVTEEKLCEMRQTVLRNKNDAACYKALSAAVYHACEHERLERSE